MPPKTAPKKGNKRSHPYKAPKRSSTRQAASKSRVDQPSGSEEVAEQPVVELPTPQQALSVASNVTRAEFSQLQASMQSMQTMMQGMMTAMANFAPNTPDTNQASSVAQPPTATQAQMSSNQPVNQTLTVPNPTPSPSTSNQGEVGASPIPVITGGSVANQLVTPPAVVFSNPPNTGAVPALMSLPTARPSLQQHVENIINAPAFNVGKSLPPIPVSHDVDQKVPQSVIQDIWEEKYIELESLLDKPDLEMANSNSILPGKPGEPVTWGPNKPKNKIYSLPQWATAFEIFVAVYTRRFPEQAPNLMTYTAKVKSLASAKGDFIAYDKGFRLSRARHRTPWETPDLELWLDCAQAGLRTELAKLTGGSKPNSQPFRAGSSAGASSSQSNKLQHPAGTCFIFHNRGGRCTRTNCKFPHACYFPGCGAAHSIYSCPKFKASGGAASGKPPAKPSNTSSPGVRPASNSGKSS